jgi:hypothetical protein
MSRGEQVFRQTDVTKALKATVSAGMSVRRVEIDRDGKIVVVIGNPAKGEPFGTYDWADVQ